MADVGLDAELVLAIDAALAQVDVLEARLTEVTTDVPVTADVTAMVAEIENAMTEASSQTVTVDADTAAIPTSIEDAVAAVDVSDVVVNADTGAIPTEIDAAVASVSVPAVEIAVEADTADAAAQIADLGSESSSASEHVGGLEGSVTGLGAAAGITEGSAKELVSTIGELGGESATAAAGGILGLGAATAGFFEEGMNAVSAGERFDLVLGDMGNKIKEIDVNGLKTNVDDLGITFGSTSAEMENANSKLFQMAINSGATKDQAVLFTQQVETLSARAISLNPQLGSLADVTESLGTKIGRGGRFAANYGLDLNAAEISTRALADTGKSLTSELTFAEKAIAGAELASEKYGGTLAGTVAEGQKNAAVQASELKARFKEAIEQIGVPLVAPILDLIKQAEPDAVAVAETLGKLGHDVLPVVSSALAIIGPPLGLVADALNAIPGPVVAGAAAFWLMSSAMEAIAEKAALDAVALELLQDSTPYLAAIGAAFVAINAVMGDSGNAVSEQRQSIDTAAKGFDDLTVSVKDTVDAEVQAAVSTDDVSERMNTAGVSADQLSDALRSGGDAWDRYRAALEAVDTEKLKGDGGIFGSLGLGGSDLEVHTDKMKNLLDDLRDSTEAAAHASLEKAVTDGKLSAEERDHAVATAGTIEGQTNYSAALESVQPKIADAIQAEKDAKQAEDDAAAAAKAHAESLTLISAQAPAVAMTMENVTITAGDQTSALTGLALALGDANLKTKDFDTVAGELGVTSEALKGFVSDVTKEVDAFVSTAMGGLPQVGDAIDRVLNPKKEKPKAIVIDPVQLQAELDEDINRINGFNLNLQVLINAGYNNLARVASERGPEFTQALVTNFQNGGADATAALDSKFTEMNAVVAAEPDHLREVGVGIATATGDIGTAASKRFGETFNLEPEVAGEVDGSRIAVADKGPAIVTAVTGMSADAAEHWAAGFGQITPHTQTTLDAAVSAVENAVPGMGTAGTAAGDAAHGGVQDGVDKIPGTTEDAIKSAGDSITTAAGPLRFIARIEGAGIGQAFDEGMKGGIEIYSKQVADAAAQMVTDAADSAKAASRAHSPSQLFAEIGADISAGLALGITSGQADVDAAISRQITAAAPVMAPIARVQVPSSSYGREFRSTTTRSGPLVHIGQQVFVTPDPVMSGRENARQLRTLAADATLASR